MDITAKSATLDDIRSLRELYRQEMNCQIIHDSLHTRQGWTLSWLLFIDGGTAGYGSIAVAGPWAGKRTVFEFYALPLFRGRVFDLFTALLSASGATFIETQSNDPLLTVMLHTFAHSIAAESILFHDKLTTSLDPPGVLFRPATPADTSQIAQQQLDAQAGWLLELKDASSSG
jgi:hypothetical protein